MSDIHQLEQLVSGEYGDPHRILGPHTEDGSVLVRVYKPLAESVVVTGVAGAFVGSVVLVVLGVLMPAPSWPVRRAGC